MSRPYQIRFVGGAAGVSHADLSATLLRLLKGDEAKVDEMLDSPGMVMARCATETEATALQDRLRGFGIECRIDLEPPVAAATAATNMGIKASVVCPHCGTQQDAGENCRQCGNPLNSKVALLYSAKARQQALEAQAEAEVAAERPVTGYDGHSWNFRFVAVVVLLVVVGAYFSFRADLPEWAGGNSVVHAVTDSPDGSGGVGQAVAVKKGKPDSASMMIIKGMFSGGANKGQPAPKYDPEAGENPYSQQLKAIGVDTDELAKAQGFEGGVTADQFNEALKNSGIAGGISGVTGGMPELDQEATANASAGSKE